MSNKAAFVNDLNFVGNELTLVAFVVEILNVSGFVLLLFKMFGFSL